MKVAHLLVWIVALILCSCRPDQKCVPPDLSDAGITQDKAVAIVLAHLKIKEVTKEPSDNFNLRISEEQTTRDQMTERLDARHGTTKYDDFSTLPQQFAVYHVTIQHGMAGDSEVYITKRDGRVILEKYIPEG